MGEDSANPFFVGTASWNLPKIHAPRFPLDGSVLERYAAMFNAVEVNSSFYRDHQPATYARWAQSVPAPFRFSVKLSRRFTHERRLDVSRDELAENLAAIHHLGEKLGVLLVQLPPSLSFERAKAEPFFAVLRELHQGPIALEPRHLSWREFTCTDIASVIADPPRVQMAGTDEIQYFRLHGSPEVYRSDYAPETLQRLAQRMCAVARKARQVWCIFDNTTFGHATANALTLSESCREFASL